MSETKLMTSAEVRRRLVDELRLDLVGPPAHDLDHPLARVRATTTRATTSAASRVVPQPMTTAHPTRRRRRRR